MERKEVKCINCGKRATHYAISSGGLVMNDKPLCDEHAKTNRGGKMPIELWHETMLQDFSTIFEEVKS
jgi:hypothetical protein